MKKFVIDDDCIKKMNDCFCNQEEASQFFSDLGDIGNMIFDVSRILPMISKEEGRKIIIKEIFQFASFCRDHIELIHRMIAAYDGKEISEEEYDKLCEDCN